MDTDKSNIASDIQVGRFSFNHNSFLLVLACLAAVAFALADTVGVPASNEGPSAMKLAAPQMIWALLLLPIGGFGARAFSRAGHRDTAKRCVIGVVAFFIGACISTFLL